MHRKASEFNFMIFVIASVIVSLLVITVLFDTAGGGLEDIEKDAKTSETRDFLHNAETVCSGELSENPSAEGEITIEEGQELTLASDTTVTLKDGTEELLSETIDGCTGLQANQDTLSAGTYPYTMGTTDTSDGTRIDITFN